VFSSTKKEFDARVGDQAKDEQSKYAFNGQAKNNT
jgi:hypothetical protein